MQLLLGRNTELLPVSELALDVIHNAAKVRLSATFKHCIFLQAFLYKFCNRSKCTLFVRECHCHCTLRNKGVHTILGNTGGEVFQELVVVGMPAELLKLGDISLLVAPLKIVLRCQSWIAVLVQVGIEVEVRLHLCLGQLVTVGISCVLLIGVVLELVYVVVLGHQGVQSALVIGDHHADVVIGQHLLYVCIAHTYSDRATVLSVPFRVLYGNGFFVWECLAFLPYILAVGIQTGSYAVCLHSWHQAQVYLDAGQTELLGKGGFLGVCMYRQTLCRQVCYHLNVVKHHSWHIVAEGLQAHTAYLVCCLG